MSRKYRQRGYQDDGERGDKSRRSGKSPGPRHREGPRSPRMMGFQKLARCSMCGAEVAGLDEVEPSSACPNCGSDLHTCRNCVFFDTSARFECTQPIPERVSPKDRRNECEYFEIKSRVEKMTSSAKKSVAGKSSGDLDPREAFERLFKK
ncbi:MAG TPA: hypothetical protein VLV83_14470 [Acidobacteriota bacterium]|nr:hypothetical protein [Acidobacteriota bacterium]